MEIEAFLQNCERQGIHLWIDNGQLCYRSNAGVMTEEILTALKNRKAEIILFLCHTFNANSQFKLTSTSQNRALLFNRIIWSDYAGRKMDSASNGNIHIVIRISGENQIDALVKSITVLLGRHKALNSAIEMSEGKLYLVHSPNLAPAFQEIIVKGETVEHREQEAMRIANDLVWKALDLDCGPLYRVFVIKITETDSMLGVVLHHAIGDGISIGTFFQELAVIYSSIVSNVASPLPPVEYQYFDYLSSLETWLTSATGVDHVNYWTNLLKSTPETHLIYNDCLQKIHSSSGPTSEEIITFDSDVTRDIKKIAAQLKTTLFTVLLAAQKVAIWQMTAQEELVILSVHSGRINVHFNSIIGDFTSEIAYKTSLKGNPSFVEIIERVKQTIVNADLHQPVPFDYIRHQLLEEGIIFSAPVMHFPLGKAKDTHTSSGPCFVRFPFPKTELRQPYMMMFNNTDKEIAITLPYRTDLYEKSTMFAFIEHFRKTVITIINDPDKKLHDFIDSGKDF